MRAARERGEAVRRGELAHAVGDARATEADVDAAAARTLAARDALAAARIAKDEATTPARLVLHERFVARRRAELERALAAEARARAIHGGKLDAVDAARGQLAQARAERELIERHFARWRDAQRKLADRRADD